MSKTTVLLVFWFWFFSLQGKSIFIIIYRYITLESGGEGLSLQVLSGGQAETDACRMLNFCRIQKGFRWTSEAQAVLTFPWYEMVLSLLVFFSLGQWTTES